MADALKKSCLDVLRQVCQEGYRVTSLNLSDQPAASSRRIIVRTMMNLCLLLHHLLLIEVCIVNFSISLMLPCGQRLSSTLHRFECENRLS